MPFLSPPGLLSRSVEVRPLKGYNNWELIRDGATHRRMVGTSTTKEGTIVKPEKEKTTQQGAKENTRETPPFEKPSHCLICGQRGPTLLYGHWICDHCMNIVLAEAIAKKRQIEKEGGGPVLAR
jgi:hypothetical protein